MKGFRKVGKAEGSRQKAVGRKNITLSLVVTIGLMLGVFVAQEAGAATDVYLVRPQANTHNNSYNYVSQSFVATADSVTKISFFLGAKSGGSNYQMEIDSAGIAKGGVMTLNFSGAYPYTDNEGTYGTPVGVKRGYTYTLKFSRASAMEAVDFYYVPDTTYRWGTITYPSGINGDLCARVVGVNRTDSTYWGMNGEEYSWGGALDTMASSAKQIGINLDREQERWRDLQPHPNSFNWVALDTIVTKDSTKGIRVLIDIYATPPWASSQSFSIDSVVRETSAWRYPPRGLDSLSGWQHHNYLWMFLDSLVRHYSKKGVHDYEIWNETNYYDNWRYGIDKGDTCGYDPNNYHYDQSGRAKLYVKACQVAWDAIKNADSQARVQTNAVLCMMAGNTRDERGREWMQDYYHWGGKAYADIIGWHWYLSPDANGIHNDTTNHRFQPRQFIAEYDTLRRIMRDGGDGAKPVWANEGSYGSPSSFTWNSLWSVSRLKQADIVLQASVTGLGQRENGIGPALDQVSWYKLYDRIDGSDTMNWAYWCGLLKLRDSCFAYKPSAYAHNQMTGKLAGLYFNRRLMFPDTNVYCYEFQTTDTGLAARKTWVVWRATEGAVIESLPVRTPQFDTIKIAYASVETTGQNSALANGSGKIIVDTMPLYYRENGTVSRPDVTVDSVWLVPSSPRAGDSVWFYARLKNIGNDSVKFNIVNKVTFQVDGTTKATYQASRGLAPAGDPYHKDTLTVGNSIATNPKDWQTNYGDHLIRAWADSANVYVELRTDNNIGYLFKHVPPTGTINIPGTSYPNGRKFSNVQPVKISMLSNGGTLPSASQMEIKNSWESNWRSWRSDTTFWWDTLPTSPGLYSVQAEFKMATGETSAIAIDSIVLDNNPPYAHISSPVQNQVVSGTVPFKGNANDGYEHHLSYWEIRKDVEGPWCSGDTEIGKLYPLTVPGTFGNWNSTWWPNGYYWHRLMVNDSAGNTSKDSVRVYVNNNGGGGSGFASGFGSTPSLTMNVATDPSGNVYIAETQNSKVRKYSPRKDSLFAFSARRGDSTGLNWAVGMVLKDSTTIYVADGYAHAIKQFDRQGNLLLRFGSFGTGQGQFRQPCGIALDGKGRIFVSDRLNNRIQVFDSTGHFLFQFGSQGSDSGRFNSPTGITYVPKDTTRGLTQDQVYISDTRNNQVQVFDSLGNYLKTIKQVDSLGLDTPLGICPDRYGDIFIADARHNRIVELNPFGQRILDFGGQGDSLCQFQTPVGVASSPGAQYLYVADMGNKRVQRFWVIQGDSTGGGGPQSNGWVRLPPKVYFLNQSYPNPTTGEALIEYGLPKESEVRLVIYNVAGQVVREYNPGNQKAWYYSIQWDGRSNYGHKVGCGVYFYRLKAGDWVKTRKMVVVR